MKAISTRGTRYLLGKKSLEVSKWNRCEKIFPPMYRVPANTCVDATRLAKFLDMKNHLFLAARHPKHGTSPGRLIGRQIDIRSSTKPYQVLATYKLYMGKKDKCDSSYPNCEGIVIEYIEMTNNKRILMMGDVNYSSFDKARSTTGDPIFSDTQIDYLIAPHHGSEYTDYVRISNGGTFPKKGDKAIICCTNEPTNNRPNNKHREELKIRFDNVITTEEVTGRDVSIMISL